MPGQTYWTYEMCRRGSPVEGRAVTPTQRGTACTAAASHCAHQTAPCHCTLRRGEHKVRQATRTWQFCEPARVSEASPRIVSLVVPNTHPPRSSPRFKSAGMGSRRIPPPSGPVKFPLLCVFRPAPMCADDYSRSAACTINGGQQGKQQKATLRLGCFALPCCCHRRGELWTDSRKTDTRIATVANNK